MGKKTLANLLVTSKEIFGCIFVDKRDGREREYRPIAI